MQKKHLLAIIYSFFVFIIIYYAFIYFTNINTITNTSNSIKSEISNYNEVNQ